MDVREKLIEILRKPIFPHELVDPIEAVADYLLDSGVTVQDGKPLEAFLHPVDAYKGLKAKYLVFKADTGEIVENCFVLRPDKDHASVEALRAYASATDNETLEKDIYNWVGKGVTVQGCKVAEIDQFKLPIDDAILILKEEYKQRVDGYATHLSYGGNGDPAEEVHIDALGMAIAALELQKQTFSHHR